MLTNQEFQMDIPQEFPSESPFDTCPPLQSLHKQQPRQQINYFQSNKVKILRNNKSNTSVNLKQNSGSASNNPLQQSKREWKGKNIQEFLEFQENFVRQREDHILRLKERKNEEEGRECTGRPSINSHSRKLTSQVVEPYYERLSKSKSKSNHIHTQSTFQPKITTRSRSIEREQDVSQILYSDALRRIQKQNINHLQKSVKQILQPKINTNTDKLIIKTLKSQFQQLTAGISQLTLPVSISIIKTMFNVDLNKKDPKDLGNSQLNIFANTIFTTNKPIPKQKLWSFAQILLGINNSTYFSKQQITSIQQNFGYLYRNRMTKVRKGEVKNTPTFKPEILKSSQKLAERKRMKLLENAERLNLIESNTDEIAVSDLYLIERTFKQNSSRAKKIQERELQQSKECTFKPVLTNWKGYKECQVASTNSSRKRTEHLKTMSRCENTNETLRSQYSSNSIKYNDLTERNSRKSSRSKEVNVVKNLELSVQRMSAAREQRLFSNEFRERGYPQNVGNYQNHRQSAKKSIERSQQKLRGHINTPTSHTPSNSLFTPASNSNSKSISSSKLVQQNIPKPKQFIFDIHINTGVIETIRLKATDDPEEIVMGLARKHKLEESKKQKLFDLICYYITKEIQKH